MRSWFLIAMSIITLGQEVWAQSGAGAPTWRPVVMGKNGMVAAEHPLQALAGLRVLQSGGNAVDAAVAVFYMTAVTEPSEAGLGGDGFLLAYIKNLDRSHPDQRQRRRAEAGDARILPGQGWRCPGGRTLFHLGARRGGRIRPAAQEVRNEGLSARCSPMRSRAASHGYAVSAWGAGNFTRSRGSAGALGEFGEGVSAGRQAAGIGDWLVQRDLAKTISTIREHGADAFYRGDIARMTARYHERAGGLIRYEDLAGFKAEEAAPIHESAIAATTSTSRRPTPAALSCCMALNILEGFDLKKLGHNTPALPARADRSVQAGVRRPLSVHHRSAFRAGCSHRSSCSRSAMRRLRRGLIKMDRAIAGVAPPGRSARRAMRFWPVMRFTISEPGKPRPAAPRDLRADGEQTSSFAIADRWGNVVSVTHSVNGGFGSGMVVEGAGFLLNNRGSYFGLDPADINVIAPGKRTRQGAIPAMALKEWQTVSGLEHARRRYHSADADAGVSECRGVRDERATGRRGALHRRRRISASRCIRRIRAMVWPCRNSWRTGSAPRWARWVIPFRACRSSLPTERPPGRAR